VREPASKAASSIAKAQRKIRIGPVCVLPHRRGTDQHQQTRHLLAEEGEVVTASRCWWCDFQLRVGPFSMQVAEPLADDNQLTPVSR
jgi:hypothetical protein